MPFVPDIKLKISNSSLTAHHPHTFKTFHFIIKRPISMFNSKLNEIDGDNMNRIASWSLRMQFDQ